MEYRVQCMWVLDVFSEDKLYMVTNLRRVLSVQRWRVVVAAHALAVVRTKSTPNTAQVLLGKLERRPDQAFKVSSYYTLFRGHLDEEKNVEEMDVESFLHLISPLVFSLSKQVLGVLLGHLIWFCFLQLNDIEFPFQTTTRSS